MLKACSYCGRLHDINAVCSKKPKQKHIYKKSKSDYEEAPTDIRSFRNSKAWQRKREYIKRRDGYVCAACLAGLKGTKKRLNTQDLSVHHIVPLAVDFDLRLDDDNLITLCCLHHELAESGVIAVEELRKVLQTPYYLTSVFAKPPGMTKN